MSKRGYDSRTASEKSEESGLTRRSLLKNAAGVALGAAAASVIGANRLRAQVSGLYTTNEPPQIPLPMGALTYLDKKQYIHNMEIHAHLPGVTIDSFNISQFAMSLDVRNLQYFGAIDITGNWHPRTERFGMSLYPSP